MAVVTTWQDSCRVARNSLIIDFGSNSVRAGFTELHETPDLNFRSVLSKCKSKKGHEVFVGQTSSMLGDHLKAGLKSPFEDGVLVSLENAEYLMDHVFQHFNMESADISYVDFPVIMSESPVMPFTIRNQLLELVFEGYNINKFSFFMDALAANFHGFESHNTVLIISLGHQAISLYPVIDDHVDISNIVRLPFGSAHLSGYLCKLIQLKYPYSMKFVNQVKADELFTNNAQIQLPNSAPLNLNICSENITSEKLSADNSLFWKSQAGIYKSILVTNLSHRASTIEKELLISYKNHINNRIIEFFIELLEIEFHLAKLDTKVQSTLNPDFQSWKAKMSEILSKSHLCQERLQKAEHSCELELANIQLLCDGHFQTWFQGLKLERDRLSEIDQKFQRLEKLKQTIGEASSLSNDKIISIDDDSDDFDVEFKGYANEVTVAPPATQENRLNQRETARLNELNQLAEAFETPEISNKSEFVKLSLTSNQLSRAPEALFHPSLIGIHCAGIHECVANVISSYADDRIKTDLARNIRLVGGGSLIKGLPERLCHELTSKGLLPIINDRSITPKVTVCPCPTNAPYQGVRKFLFSSPTPDFFMSKAEYAENGPRILYSAKRVPLHAGYSS